MGSRQHHNSLTRTAQDTLDYGLRVIMVLQDYAPVISFHLMFDAGGIDEPEGSGGAHMVEQMAFKGTSTIGSWEFEQESVAFERVERVADRYFAELKAAELPTQLDELRRKFSQARDEAGKLAEPNVLQRIVDVQ